MNTSSKVILAAIAGLCVIFVISMAGCGSIELAGLGPDAGETGIAGAGGAAGTVGAAGTGVDAGTHDVFAMMTGMAGAIGTSGAAGVGGTGVTGTAGVGGTAGVAGAGGSPVRPLGAGCTTDDQCGSGICAKAKATDTAGACCNGRPDTCSVCIGGYRTLVQDETSVDACRVCRGGQITALADGTPAGACNTCAAGKVTPVADGMKCGEPQCTGVSSVLPGGQFPYYRSSRSHICMAGACTAIVRDCTMALTCAGGKMQDCGSSGFCNGVNGEGDCGCYTGNNTATSCEYP